MFPSKKGKRQVQQNEKEEPNAGFKISVTGTLRSVSTFLRHIRKSIFQASTLRGT